MLKKTRHYLWRLLGIDYPTFLKKIDYTLLKNDKFSSFGIGTYDNGANAWRWTNAKLEIGNYCSIAFGVNFIVDEGFHGCSQITSFPFINNLTTNPDLVKLRNEFNQKEGIQIGNDVWIGLNTIILPGVRIGNGVTIAAGSVVSKNIPDYTIVGGVPAKVIKKKHTDENIDKLLSIAWWDWDEKTINERKEDFYLKIEEFIVKYYEN